VTPTSSANAAVRAPEEAPPQLGPRSSQFLVRDVKAGQVLLMSSETEGSRVIARAASGLYQAEVGLFWYRDGSELKVLDLNAADSSAVTVANGLPKIDRFAIIDHAAEAYVDDGCDELPTLQLKWTADPSFDFFEEGVEPQITNREWLKRELERKPREVGTYQELSDGGNRARVPKRLLSCETRGACGNALPLGDTGVELVLVRQRAGGDCVHTACMLHDPKTKQFAKPPHGESWGKADKSQLGSCGPYRFDRTNSKYLVDNQLCTAQGCKTLKGPALDWLEPGDVIGQAGVTDSGAAE